MVFASCTTYMTRGETTFLESVYFHFVTYTTIGFGDYLPCDRDCEPTEYVIFFLKLLIGLSLMSVLLAYLAGMGEHLALQLNEDYQGGNN